MFDRVSYSGTDNIDHKLPGLGTIDLVVVLPCGSAHSATMIEYAINLIKETAAYCGNYEVTEIDEKNFPNSGMALVLIASRPELVRLRRLAREQGIRNIICIRTHTHFHLGKEVRALPLQPSVVEADVFVLLVPGAQLREVTDKVRAAMPEESGIRCSIIAMP